LGGNGDQIEELLEGRGGEVYGVRLGVNGRLDVFGAIVYTTIRVCESLAES
jgi:hypothetical protein